MKTCFPRLPIFPPHNQREVSLPLKRNLRVRTTSASLHCIQPARHCTTHPHRTRLLEGRQTYRSHMNLCAHRTIPSRTRGHPLRSWQTTMTRTSSKTSRMACHRTARRLGMPPRCLHSRSLSENHTGGRTVTRPPNNSLPLTRNRRGDP